MVDRKNKNVLGFNEDAVAIKYGDTNLVMNIDGWVASTDRPIGMDMSSAAYRATINSFSDLIAKGVRPTGMIASSSIKDSVDFRQIVDGLSRACDDYDVAYLGGDLNTSDDIVIDVVCFGFAKNLIRRDGANPGEILYWLGIPLGSTAAAIGILTKDWIGDKKKALDIMGNPSLSMEFLDVSATAAIDCSDGLARSLHLLSKSSKVGFQLDGIVSTSTWVTKVAKDNKVTIEELALYGGEELSVIFTLPKGEKVPKDSLKLGIVTQSTAITIEDVKIPNKGWTHFNK
jgi:thiamine-monophosphate kinase